MPYLLLAIIFSIINLGVGVTVPAMTAIVMQAAGPSYANTAGATLNVNRHQIIARLGVPPHRHQPNKTGCPQNEIPKIKYSISHYLHGESPVALK